MLSSSIEQLRRSMTYRYMLALSIIAMLSTLAFYVLNTALKGADSTALVVNMAGKQRMLAQHIALDVHEVCSKHHHSLCSNEELTETSRASLIVNIKEMSLSNQKLSSGKLSDTIQHTPSPALYEMYFGEMNLAQRVSDYLLTAKRILESQDSDSALTILQQIDELSKPLATDLDRVVSQYQLEGEQKLESLKYLEFCIWIITLLVLILEIVFIFSPMVLQVITSKEAEQKVHQSLNELVEERTLKLKEANHKLQLLAQHDPLTGLKNRLTLEDDIEELIMGYQNNGAPFAVVMLDVDRFKEVNDKYGHAIGDYVLTELSSILSRQVREYDDIYRAGGEEFVLVFNRIDLSDALDLVEGLRKTIENNTFEYQDVAFGITVSCGLYHTDHQQVKNVHECLKLADAAMYESKQQGRNRITEAKSKT